MVDALVGQHGHDGPADLVPRQQLVDEALAVAVAQQRAVPPQRLGQQRPRHRRVVQRGRVELDELEVGDRHSRPQGHGDAVAGRLGGVGRHGEELPGAPRGDQDVPRPDGLDAAARGAGGDTRAATAPRRSGRARTSARRPRPPCGAPRRPAPARPRRPWPRRRRARRGRASARPRGPAGARRAASRSKMAPRAISSLTRAGPSSTRTRTASSSHSPAPAARVSARCRSVESGSPPSTAATPPWAQRVVAWASSPLVRTPTRRPWTSAARTAADRPATPDPRTSRSSTGASPAAGGASVGRHLDVAVRRRTPSGRPLGQQLGGDGDRPAGCRCRRGRCGARSPPARRRRSRRRRSR